MWVLGRFFNNNNKNNNTRLVQSSMRCRCWVWQTRIMDVIRRVLLLQHPSSLYEIIRRGIVRCFGHFKLLLLEGKGVFVVVCSWNANMMSIGSLGVKTSTYRHLQRYSFCCLRLEITASTRHLQRRPFRTLASKQSETAYKIRAQCNRAFSLFFSSSCFLFFLSAFYYAIRFAWRHQFKLFVVVAVLFFFV